MAETVLYHRTSPEIAQAIFKRGFRDHTGSWGLVGHTFTGVFFSLGGPLDANEGAFGDVVLRVTVDLGLRDLRYWEWQEEGKPFREFLVPARLIKAHLVRLELIDDDAEAPDGYPLVINPETRGKLVVERNAKGMRVSYHRCDDNGTPKRTRPQKQHRR